jgi:hypothetical protein
MNPSFDIFIPCAEKDYYKLQAVIQSAFFNLKNDGLHRIFVCTPNVHGEFIKYPDVVYVTDDDCLSVNRSAWKHRPNWQYQMCLKLFQQVTSDLFLTIDSDTIINRPLDLWDESGKPIWYYGWDQDNKPYHKFDELMIGIGNVAPFSFIGDMCFMNREIINEIIDYSPAYDAKSWITEAQRITTPDCYMAEGELYGSFCYVHHPDMYTWKKLKQAPCEGRSNKERDSFGKYTEQEIIDRIKKYKSMDYDTFSIHSWVD